MRRARQILAFPLVAACLVALLISACGGAGGEHSTAHSSAAARKATAPTGSAEPEPAPRLGAEVVVRVDADSITRAMVVQWMREKIGQFFYEYASRRPPARLVTEPADYAACVASLEAIAPHFGAAAHQAAPTSAQLMSKCEDLYTSFKEDALLYLIPSYWTISFMAEHGLKVSEPELQRALRATEAKAQRHGATFEEFLVSHARTLAQERFLTMIELLRQKLNEGVRRRGRFAKEAITATVVARCRPGYVVSYCRGYKPRTSGTTIDGSVILEEIAKWLPASAHGDRPGD